MDLRFKELPAFFLRLGLGYCFLFAAFEIFIFPERLTPYIPDFITTFIPANIFHPLFGIFEVILAIWLILGKKLLIPSIIASMMLLGIILFNLDKYAVLFRNIGLMFSAVSLAIMTQTESSKA